MSPSTYIVRLCATCLGLAMVGLVFAVLMAAAAPAKEAPAASTAANTAVQISIDNFTFAPATLSIKAGTKVTWVNRDDIPHTVTEKAFGFKSQVLDTDDAFTYTFDKPGDVEYFCSLHPHMVGHIVVE